MNRWKETLDTLRNLVSEWKPTGDVERRRLVLRATGRISDPARAAALHEELDRALQVLQLESDMDEGRFLGTDIVALEILDKIERRARRTERHVGRLEAPPQMAQDLA
jgi:hypothetical protein